MISLLVAILVLLIVLALIHYVGGALGLPGNVVNILLIVALLVGCILLLQRAGVFGAI